MTFPFGKAVELGEHTLITCWCYTMRYGVTVPGCAYMHQQ